MTRRTAAQWQTIIEHQQASDLNIAQYCQQHHINPKSFYARRQSIRQADAPPPSVHPASFVKVLAPSQPNTPMILKTPQATLHIPADISAQWVGDLIKALSV